MSILGDDQGDSREKVRDDNNGRDSKEGVLGINQGDSRGVLEDNNGVDFGEVVFGDEGEYENGVLNITIKDS